MNYKIAKTMLVLCVVYLIGFYILKFIFPELLLLSITSPIMIRLGDDCVYDIWDCRSRYCDLAWKMPNN